MQYNHRRRSQQGGGLLDQDVNSDDDLVSSVDDEPVWHIKEKAMKNYADYFFYIK
jgi:hypothetical protein